GLEQAMTTSIKTRLDKLVARKVITAAQEKSLLSRVSARVVQAVNQKGLPFMRPRFGGKLPTPPGLQMPPAYAPAPAAPPVA
ncbi:MAG TPA: hypothetical protein VJ741_01960, partial [Solirubrobacteraceae bacterium]|nr:hypothetical protein [Solirubrobacteraceae bacterium]